MKKLILLATLPLMLTGCTLGNFTSKGSYSFHCVHVQMYGETEPTHLKIVSWKEDKGGIELKTENYGSIILGDGTYMMYDSDNCPLCGRVSYK